MAARARVTVAGRQSVPKLTVHIRFGTPCARLSVTVTQLPSLRCHSLLPATLNGAGSFVQLLTQR